MNRRQFAALLAAQSLAAAPDSAADAIRRLGGTVEAGPGGQPVAVSLSGTWVNDSELIELAAMPSLERLDLSHTRISDEGLLLLRPARRIQSLNLLYAEQITDQGMNAIKTWRELRHLNVRGTRIADGTLQVASGLTRLEALDVSATGITENGLDHLVALANLKRLEIGRNRLREESLAMLRLLPEVEYLDLSGPRAVNRNQRREANRLASPLVEAIAELDHLRVLKLGHLNIDTEGLQLLAARLTKLERLGLELCPRITDATLPVLEAWKSLKQVDLQESAVTAPAVRKLQQARPDLQLLSGPFPAV